MMPQDRNYLDNAATSWPKPDAVYAAVDRYLREVGASAGRGAYDEAIEAADAVRRTRAAIGRLIGVRDARQIVFTTSGTDALNLAIHGLLDRRGGHVVTTVAEHNSVLRPLRALADAGWITVTHVACNGEGVIEPDVVRAVMRADTRLVAVTHASNVTGAINPVAEIAAIAHERDALCLVDAAQTLGEIPLNVENLGVDLLAAPGHKGLLGPQGTGVLYLREGVERDIDALRQGGTGSSSESDEQPLVLPHKYESGTLNVPALAGLGAGVAWLLERGVEAVRQHAMSLSEQLRQGLATIDGVRHYEPEQADARVGIVSITIEGCDPHDVAAVLDAAYRVQTRAGLHCAGRMHEALGTLAGGGTLRFSVGPFNTSEHIECAVAAVQAISAGKLAV